MKDFDLEFNRHPMTGDVSVRSGNDALLQSVRNIVLTALGDLKAEQGFGVGFESLLGENDVDVIGNISIQDQIYRQVERFEPRVELKSVTVRAMPDRHKLKVSVVFMPVNVDEIVKFDDYLDVLI